MCHDITKWNIILKDIQENGCFDCSGLDYAEYDGCPLDCEKCPFNNSGHECFILVGSWGWVAHFSPKAAKQLTDDLITIVKAHIKKITDTDTKRKSDNIDEKLIDVRMEIAKNTEILTNIHEMLKKGNKRKKQIRRTGTC